MLRQCITLAVLGCAVAAPQHQYQTQQQDEGIPPHLLREYIGAQQPAQAQTQIIPRPAHLGGAQVPARLPYQVQAENQYQPRPQYQPQPQPQQQQYRQQYTQEAPQRTPPHPSYQFGFDVNDDQYTNYQNRKEQRDGDVIKGSYSVVDSDGFVRTVTYTADPKEGFKAEVSRKPTDIVKCFSHTILGDKDYVGLAPTETPRRSPPVLTTGEAGSPFGKQTPQIFLSPPKSSLPKLGMIRP
ncbi:Larval cuticle protein A3A [Papilio xuthus]|uniref:Larval cuticle protein A3A n=1 Tax=Papilio xuthus TaxID=66420 RepID=A0A194Q3P7_PAPXU|nr:Larval cuticle protein A3A [Papilio xuthus]